MCTVKEYVQKNGIDLKVVLVVATLISILMSAFFTVSFFVFDAKGASDLSKENKKDITILKEDFREIKTNQKHFNNTQKIMHDDLKSVQKDIKLLLRR